MLKFIAAVLLLLVGAAQAQTLQSRDINGDGTVDAFYDTSQDISWLADANYAATLGLTPGTTFFGTQMDPGQMSFVNAVNWVASLTVLGLGDWRLPSRFVPAGGPSPFCDATSCDGSRSWGSELSILAETLAGTTGPFLNLQSGQYMTNEVASHLELHSMLTNNSQITDETSVAWGYVLPVHQGDVGQSAQVTPVPEPSTYALMLVGLIGLTFYNRKRRSAPASR